MQSMSISKFKATCLAVLERVRRTGEPVQVTKFGRPIANVVPSAPREGGLTLGYMLDGAEVETVGPEESGWDGGENEIIREWDELNAESAPTEPRPMRK
jgi:prevent-host-death family protein